jgi:hypothetical protein
MKKKRTIFFGILDEVLPAVVHAQQEWVPDDDEEGLGPGDGHVEPEQQAHLVKNA